MESVITEILQSEKLKDVNYEIRGPVLDYANFLEQEGQQILKLNIGNPGAFGFDAPDEIIRDVIHNLREGPRLLAKQRYFYCSESCSAILPISGSFGD
jgi:alanine-synthesizing transaminase